MRKHRTLKTLFIRALTAGFFCVGNVAIAVMPMMAAVAASPVIEPSVTGRGDTKISIPMDKRPFRKRGRTIESSGNSTLKLGGYCGQPGVVRETTYRLNDEPRGRAEVDVVVLSMDYGYVVHDFFGSFVPGVDRLSSAKRSSTPKDPLRHSDAVRFVQYTPTGAEKPAVLYSIMLGNEDLKSGMVAWYSTEGDQVTIVFIGYEHLKGAPTQLIDQYLDKVHSDLVLDDPTTADWRRKDVDKWIHLLETDRDDVRVLSRAASRLSRYAKESFRIDAALAKIDDPKVFEHEMDKAVDRIKRWAEAYFADQPTGKIEDD